MPVRRFAQGQENNDTILDVQRVYNERVRDTVEDGGEDIPGKHARLVEN